MAAISGMTADLQWPGLPVAASGPRLRAPRTACADEVAAGSRHDGSALFPFQTGAKLNGLQRDDGPNPGTRPCPAAIPVPRPALDSRQVAR